MTSWADCLHEARHICAIWFLDPGLRVDEAAVGPHAGGQGIVRTSRISGEPGIEDLIGRLSGWLGDEDLPPNAVWPPPYPPPDSSADGVGWITRRLNLTKAQYEGAAAIAVELCEEPLFVEATHLVAEGLMRAPKIDHEGLEILREAAGIPDHEPEEALTTCSA